MVTVKNFWVTDAGSLLLEIASREPKIWMEVGVGSFAVGPFPLLDEVKVLSWDRMIAVDVRMSVKLVFVTVSVILWSIASRLQVIGAL